MGRLGNNSNTKKPEVVSSVRKNVKAIAEKLKCVPQEELLQLKSIQSVLSALGHESHLDEQVDNDGCRSGSTENNSSIDKSQECTTSTTTDDQPSESGIITPLWQKFELGFILRILENLWKTLQKYFLPKKPSKSNAFGLFFLILACIFYFELHTSSGFTRLWLKWENVDLGSVECTIESPHLAMEIFRPPVPCIFCQNVKSADRVENISPAEFERRYAYTGRPVVITDAMVNWTATSSFSFSFFKSIYAEGSRSLEHQGEDCLFFPYVTEFRSLAEVFNMSEARSNQPWYIGWSNCDAETSHILRQHYQRPYFLPDTAESTHADWIFMGTPGYGAHMHIDHVINPSWQAQITGKKRWFLLPPPECYWSCQSFEVDVLPGEIIVLDTNKWYHQTLILPGEMSITIGSEYD
ncbi:unnamed protein product [Allacma fusca]|uniref:JmjC domain-containing protein n=1 Tax=Allacma fusca TaxID=39272 RepID=A0A8J2KRW0_9HEXA|nr:unnamed protein product [Allacma fusca]